MRRKHKDNSILSSVMLVATAIAFIVVSSAENVNTIALILTCIAFLGAVFYALYIQTGDYQQKRRTKREKLEEIRLTDQQEDGVNTVKDSIKLLKLLNKRQQEEYQKNPDTKTLALYNTEMISVIVDVLDKLSKDKGDFK